MQRLRVVVASMFLFIGLPALAVGQDTSGGDCEALRLSVPGYWSVKKGEDAGTGLRLRPLSLSTRSPVTTMPQLAMLCRKDQNPGDVLLYGDETLYNAPLEPEECRLVALLGVESIRAKTADNFEGAVACGTYSIIR